MNKLHLITHGDYEDYRVVALIRQTKRSPALSTMYKRFEEAYRLPEYPKTSDIRTPLDYREKWSKPLDAIGQGLAKANREGYAGTLTAEVFVEWLIAQDEGFEKVEFEEFFVRD